MLRGDWPGSQLVEQIGGAELASRIEMEAARFLEERTEGALD